MIRHRLCRIAAALPLLLVAGCGDYLTGGELSTDPNRITEANSSLLFEATQPEIWTFLGSDLARFSAMFTQQLEGTDRQYKSIYNYGITESTTGGFFSGLYGGGGLYDLHKIDSLAIEKKDDLLLGIARTEEAMLMGEAASVFGDIVYSKAYSGPNPPLDPQLTVYDSVQKLLDAAIVNLRSTAATNAGPGGSDLVYGGDKDKWRRLAFTLKARFYMHTAEVNGAAAYAAALAASDSGITDPSGNYTAQFSGNAGEQNLTYQFDVVQRSGYISPNSFLVDLLKSRNDPRLETYFNSDQTDFNPDYIGTNSNGNAPMVFVSASENLLIGAEAAYKLGNEAKALTLLNEERTIQGVSAYPITTTGPALLKAILDEKYIITFVNIEAWNDYKRNCYPNITPVSGSTVPARLYYDQTERNANSSIPLPTEQPVRNANDPANATDPFGNACLGQ